MEEYASNSDRSREIKPIDTQPVKKIESTLSGNATIQKKSGFERFKDSIIAEDINNVGSWIFNEVIVTSFKRAIFDIVTNGIDMLLYGKASAKQTSQSRTSYSGYYTSGGSRYQTSSFMDQRSKPAVKSFSYDNIVFPTRGEAEEALEDMLEVIDRYGNVSVSDFYEIAKVKEVPDYTFNDYGWFNIPRNTDVLRCRDGYILKLPRIEQIKTR